MTIQVKGFVEIAALVNNTNNQVALAGELGPNERAFAPDPKLYADSANYPGLNFVSLSCKQDEVPSAVPAEAIEYIFSITQNLIDNYAGDGTAATLIATDGTLSNIEVEADVSVAATNLVKKVHATFILSGEPVNLEIYYSSSHLAQTFDEATVKIVPPIFPVTALQDTFNNIRAKISGLSIADQFALEEQIKDGQPNSHRRPYNLRWVDPTDSNNVIETTWTVLGYGPESLQTDIILEAIRDYLVANSSSTIEQWKAYLPDLEIQDNFSFIPLWGNVAFSAGPSIDTYYRPVGRLSKVADTVAENFNRRTADEVLELGEVITVLWRGIPAVAIPGLGNADSQQSFSEVFPDYALVASTSPNFALISGTTRDMMTKLERMLIIAETWTSSTVLPGDMTVEDIGGKNYITILSNGLSLKVLVKNDFSNI